MKTSPLQLGTVRYSDVVIRAIPGIEKDVGEPLPIEVVASVFYHADGEHYAMLSVNQKDSTLPYVIEVSAFATFTVDPIGCRDMYKASFNPVVIGVNVARMTYSSVRDLIASITARAPYETAQIASIIIEPSDVSLNFETGQQDAILRAFFGVSDDDLKAMHLSTKKLGSASTGKPKKTKRAGLARKIKPVSEP